MAAFEEFGVREAREDDVPAIRTIFADVYRDDYPYHGFYDEEWLKKSVFSDDILMLVAEETDTGRILGTASVIFDTGAYTDLVGEFGRLVVSPAHGGRGVGKALMAARIERVRDRIHVGLAENRTVHTHSQHISQAHGFAPVGFLPLKLLFRERESVALYVHYFGESLSLRCNHPRIIPEACALAHFALENLGLPYDAIVDEQAASYPHAEHFELEELTGKGLPALIRIERGRVTNREVFGPIRLHYGFFRLIAQHATYFVAREKTEGGDKGPVAGAIGYIRDDQEKILRVFELITITDEAIRFLFLRLLDHCQAWGTAYVEVDVSAYAPRMQRTLLELGFVPVAYLPALVFHEVERLDVVKMARLLVPYYPGKEHLAAPMRPIAQHVTESFTRLEVLPHIAEAVNRLALFRGLNEEQTQRLAGACSIRRFEKDETLFREKEAAKEMYILIEGRVSIAVDESPKRVGELGPGESVGEVSLLTGEPHSATATADEPVLAATLSRQDVNELTRQRPDIGLVLYQNLAVGLGRKLQRMDAAQTGRF